MKMRKYLIAMLMIVTSLTSAKTYYVSTSGNDSWDGLDSVFVAGSRGPWASWKKAFDIAAAGDTVFFRGGTYYPTVKNGMGMAPRNSGTPGNEICFFNFPGELPVLDNSTVYSADCLGYGYNYCINYQSNGTLGFHKYRGLEIKNVWQRGISILCVGINIGGATNLWFENMSVHDVSGGNYVFVNYDSIWVKNCDAYNACDTTHPTMPGNWGMGFSSSNRVTQWGEGAKYSYIYYEGCRAWKCSDYGFAGGPVEGYIEWNNCWSFKHGDFHFEGMTSEGVGWKQGGLSTSIEWSIDPCRVMRNCIAAENGNYGIGENNGGFLGYNMRSYNNTSYHNGYLGRPIDDLHPTWGVGFKFEGWVGDTSIIHNVYRNNISFNNRYYYTSGSENLGAASKVVKDHNSWTILGLPNPDSSDFISLDWTEMLQPRKADGSLPDINFLKLSPTSDLIDKGAIDNYSTFPYNGAAPDLGWSESSSGSEVPLSPVYVNSVVENATPSRIDITFNLSLANITPAASAFNVTVNGSARTVSSVSVSGTKVLLTLSGPVVYGNTVTVAYTKPATNPLQTSAGGQAASFTAKSVTNNVAAVNPSYVSSVIENATPLMIDITFNLTLANITPAASAFTVTVNGSARTVSSVSVSGTKVLLTLSSPVVYGNAVTVAYTKPAINPLQTSAGGQAASFTAKSVTNNIAIVNQPPYVNISSPTKSTAFIAPATVTIEAVASDPDGSIRKVEFYQGTVKLGELTSSPYFYTWKEVPAGTYSLTAVATDNQNLTTVSASVTVVVEKSGTQINQLPEVAIKISNKNKPKKHDNVVIVVEASDPDGIVTKVELKNGNVIVAEMTTAPYIYTMIDADTGVFRFTAIATDNLGAISTSQILELRVDEFYDSNSEFVRLYPNPNDGRFNIDILENLPEENNRISIFNSAGKILCNESILTNENPLAIDLEGSAPGTYILMITSGKTIFTTKKFIINR